MRFRVLAAGTRMPAWVTKGFEYYATRLPRERSLELTEIPLGRRSKGQPASRAIVEEEQRMLAVPRAGDTVVALEVAGRQFTSEQLAEKMAGWFRDGGDVIFMIGGPDGLGAGCRARASLEWSLSTLTLPHGLVRVLLAEQLYRANCILSNHPYHRG